MVLVVVAFPTLMLVYCLVSALGHFDYGSRATVMALWRCVFAHLVSLFLKSSRSNLSLMTCLCSSRYKIPSSRISVLCRFGARRRRVDCLSRLSLTPHSDPIFPNQVPRVVPHEHDSLGLMTGDVSLLVSRYLFSLLWI